MSLVYQCPATIPVVSSTSSSVTPTTTTSRGGGTSTRRSGLYLGSKNDAKNYLKLTQHWHVTHILNMTPPKHSTIQAGVPNYFENLTNPTTTTTTTPPTKIEYKRVPIYDTPVSADLLYNEYADDIVSFISKGLCYGSVLVHCQKGISRSTTAILFYFMRRLGMTLEDGLTMIQRRRPQVQPIPAFMNILRQYEQRCIQLGCIIVAAVAVGVTGTAAIVAVKKDHNDDDDNNNNTNDVVVLSLAADVGNGSVGEDQNSSDDSLLLPLEHNRNKKRSLKSTITMGPQLQRTQPTLTGPQLPPSRPTMTGPQLPIQPTMMGPQLPPNRPTLTGLQLLPIQPTMMGPQLPPSRPTVTGPHLPTHLAIIGRNVDSTNPSGTTTSSTQFEDDKEEIKQQEQQKRQEKRQKKET